MTATRALPVAPARPTTIHKAPCKHCPSARHAPDPESKDIKENWSREDQLETLFACAWRPDQLCKGWCDYIDATESDIPWRKPMDIDQAVMDRLRAPFGCEFVGDKTLGRWRIHDANDDAIASVNGREEGYARLIVQALNEHFARRSRK